MGFILIVFYSIIGSWGIASAQYPERAIEIIVPFG